MVPTIKIKGFRCSVEEAVFSNRKDGYAHVLSLAGSREAVKAVWARLMKGEAAYLDMGQQVRTARMNTIEGGKLLTERLPSGAFHGLLLSNALLRGELVLCEREEELPADFYTVLTRMLRLPLHKDWRDWLWDHAVSNGMVEQMSSQRLHAYEVNLSVYDLEVEVRQALLAGELPEVEVPVRLEGQSKAGFYPTPLEVARLIGSCLVTAGNSHLLDPCCATGEALEKVRLCMQGYARNTTHGVELEQERAQQAVLELDNVLVGDSLKAKARGGFSLLYLNPPYDQADGKRLELKFLWHWQRALLPGGVLVYVVPEKYLPEYAATITAQFENLSIYRFPEEHYDAFKQVVVFGVKRATPSYPSSLPEVAGDLSLACARYVVPEGNGTPQLYLTGQDPEVLVAEARTKGCWRRAWDLLSPPDLQAFRPPLPLRKGHVALMMASGLLNNTLVEADGRRLLVRGRVYKEVVSYDEEDDKGTKHVERDVIKTEVTALDLDTAELIEVA